MSKASAVNVRFWCQPLRIKEEKLLFRITICTDGNHADRNPVQKKRDRHKPRQSWSQLWSKTHSSVYKVLGKIDIFMPAYVHLWLKATSSLPSLWRLSEGIWQTQKIIKWYGSRQGRRSGFLISKLEQILPLWLHIHLTKA